MPSNDSPFNFDQHRPIWCRIKHGKGNFKRLKNGCAFYGDIVFTYVIIVSRSQNINSPSQFTEGSAKI